MMRLESGRGTRSVTAVAVWVGLGVSLLAQAPVVHLRLNEGGSPATTANVGSVPSAVPLRGLTLAGQGPDGSSCLLGTGIFGDEVPLPLRSDQGASAWTIAFALNVAEGDGGFQYLFGDAFEWRVFTGGGLAGQDVIMRADLYGMPPLRLPNAAGPAGWTHVAFVHEPALGVVAGFVNGVLAGAVATVGPLQIIGSFDLFLGADVDPMAAGTLIDDFRYYDRAVQLNEIESVARDSGVFQYSLNGPNASIAAGGLSSSSPADPITIELATGAAELVQLRGLLGSPFEFAIQRGLPATPARLGASDFGGWPPEFLNVDITRQVIFLNGLRFRVPLTSLDLPLASSSAGRWTYQLAVLDPSQLLGIVTSAPLETVVVDPPEFSFIADGANTAVGDPSAGFFRFEHAGTSAASVVEVVVDLAAAPAGTPAAGLVFDTDQTGMLDRFDGGPSGLPPCRNTFRGGSEIATGLIFDANNTMSPCQVGQPTGWEGSNPGLRSGDYRTLRFRFTPGSFTSGAFEFDCDTDDGRVDGRGLVGAVVTVVLDEAGTTRTLSGSIVADPADVDRALVSW